MRRILFCVKTAYPSQTAPLNIFAHTKPHTALWNGVPLPLAAAAAATRGAPPCLELSSELVVGAYWAS